MAEPGHSPTSLDTSTVLTMCYIQVTYISIKVSEQCLKQWKSDLSLHTDQCFQTSIYQLSSDSLDIYGVFGQIEKNGTVHAL